ncbi:hypothetical protein SLEP1_g33597 [Rubroshorea leprosula]|uniref:Uncharacterized protein n=1 Tax=Rubroshorea leprosula TaxID=152421 RepID=A0AAV5KHC6_9ROSI|nr:hypothetical protein SLEP1_g33597 [Rubroshorea leprosula]
MIAPLSHPQQQLQCRRPYHCGLVILDCITSSCASLPVDCGLTHTHPPPHYENYLGPIQGT